jgi:hypothetical protein
MVNPGRRAAQFSPADKRLAEVLGEVARICRRRNGLRILVRSLRVTATPVLY